MICLIPLGPRKAYSAGLTTNTTGALRVPVFRFLWSLPKLLKFNCEIKLHAHSSRPLSSGGERLLDKQEVAGSIPAEAMQKGREIRPFLYLIKGAQPAHFDWGCALHELNPHLEFVKIDVFVEAQVVAAVFNDALDEVESLGQVSHSCFRVVFL